MTQWAYRYENGINVFCIPLKGLWQILYYLVKIINISIVKSLRTTTRRPFQPVNIEHQRIMRNLWILHKLKMAIFIQFNERKMSITASTCFVIDMFCLAEWLNDFHWKIGLSFMNRSVHASLLFMVRQLKHT